MNQSTMAAHEPVPAGTAHPLVSAQGLTKAFHGRTILDGVDFNIDTGEIVVIIGKSGSGKSTLLRAMAGLTEPDQGTMRFSGADVFRNGIRTKAWDHARNDVGMVFQAYTLWPHMSVFQNLTLAPGKKGQNTNGDLRASALQALAEVGMEHHIDSRPSQLSGGERQRVAIARALMMKPKLLLCDEITSALDPPVAADVLGVLTRLKKEENLAVALVTHDMAFAAKAADRLVFFSNGKIAVDTSPDEAFSQTSNDELRRFVDAVRF